MDVRFVPGEPHKAMDIIAVYRRNVAANSSLVEFLDYLNASADTLAADVRRLNKAIGSLEAHADRMWEESEAKEEARQKALLVPTVTTLVSLREQPLEVRTAALFAATCMQRYYERCLFLPTLTRAPPHVACLAQAIMEPLQALLSAAGGRVTDKVLQLQGLRADTVEAHLHVADTQIRDLRNRAKALCRLRGSRMDPTHILRRFAGDVESLPSDDEPVKLPSIHARFAQLEAEAKRERDRQLLAEGQHHG